MSSSLSQPEFGDTDFELQGLPQPGHDSDLRARIPLELLASQFVNELRQGQNPSVELYARRYPLHSDEIRQSFAVLEVLELARLQNEATAMRRSMPHRFPFRQLGGCELLREVGRGGMGVVFEARERQTQHSVAVKVLPWRVSMAPKWRERFEAEAHTAARLRHPNIVPVYRFGQEHGYCFYTMQFVDGVGLDDVIGRLCQADGIVYPHEILQHRQQKQCSTEESPRGDTLKLTRTSWQGIVRIAIQVTQALRYAHQKGLLHNDIKPANILLDGNGRAWLSDFGLSSPMESPTASSAPGNPIGTLRYLAPERFDRPHDARSDIYSLGLTLYELVTQTAAYSATADDELRRAIREGRVVPPSSIQWELPGDLETIVLNCIALRPADRYQTADALLGDLLRFSQGQRVRSTRSGKLARFVRRWRSDDSQSGRSSGT